MRFPAAATAAMHLCVPPGAEYATAVRALQKHCTKVNQFLWLVVPGHGGGRKRSTVV